MDCVGERLVLFSSVDDCAGVLSDEGGSFCPVRVLKAVLALLATLEKWVRKEKEGKK